MRNSIGVLVTLALIPILASCRPTSSRTVVVYVSEDQVFSEPILKDFERETGIAVKSVFDTEETKSTGVMNRLIAEKDNPQADVYWANEPVRFALVDSDDAVSGKKQGKPVDMIYPDQDPSGLGVLILPNAAALIKGSPIPENGKKLIDYLLSK